MTPEEKHKKAEEILPLLELAVRAQENCWDAIRDLEMALSDDGDLDGLDEVIREYSVGGNVELDQAIEVVDTMLCGGEDLEEDETDIPDQDDAGKVEDLGVHTA